VCVCVCVCVAAIHQPKKVKLTRTDSAETDSTERDHNSPAVNPSRNHLSSPSTPTEEGHISATPMTNPRKNRSHSTSPSMRNMCSQRCQSRSVSGNRQSGSLSLSNSRRRKVDQSQSRSVSRSSHHMDTGSCRQHSQSSSHAVRQRSNVARSCSVSSQSSVASSLLRQSISSHSQRSQESRSPSHSRTRSTSVNSQLSNTTTPQINHSRSRSNTRSRSIISQRSHANYHRNNSSRSLSRVFPSIRSRSHSVHSKSHSVSRLRSESNVNRSQSRSPIVPKWIPQPLSTARHRVFPMLEGSKFLTICRIYFFMCMLW